MRGVAEAFRRSFCTHQRCALSTAIASRFRMKSLWRHRNVKATRQLPLLFAGSGLSEN